MSQMIADPRLARLGAALQQIPPSQLANELAAALGAGARALATDLRLEIAAWNELLIYLDTLGKSRFLPRSIDVAVLSDPLASARDEARRVLDALEMLVGSPLSAGLREEPLPLPSPKRGGAIVEVKGAVVGEVTCTPANTAPAIRCDRPSPLRGGDGGGVESPRATPPPRKSSNQLQIRCPACGETGAIGWDRLNHIQNCRHCGRHFAVRADGQPVEVIKSAGDRWRPKRGRSSLLRPRPRRWLIAATLLLALPLAATAGWRMVRPAAASAAEPELPRELTPRAEAFARAWLSSDVRTMKRLTSPAQDRVLYGWFAHHRPPVLAPGSIEPPHIDVAVQSVKADQTVLRVRVAGKSSVELTQTWERRGDTWYFLPPAK